MAIKRKNWTPERARSRLKKLARPRSAAQVPGWMRQGNLSVVVRGEVETYRAGSQGPASQVRTVDSESVEFAEIAARHATQTTKV